MKPYYETDLGKLYHGDCLDILPDLDKVSLILTDPPYGKNIAKTGKVGGSKAFGKKKGKIIEAKQYLKSEWDKTPPSPEVFIWIRAKSFNQIIFGGNYFSSNLYPSPCWLVWDKESTGNFADCELIYTSFKTPCRKIVWRWNGMLKEAPEERYHPTQKPVGLLMIILDRYARQCYSVIDPFFGSGSTGLACERLSRRWIGIEIEEKYCELAAKRIEAERKQRKLF